MTVKLNRLGNIFRKEFLFVLLFAFFEVLITFSVSTQNIYFCFFGIFAIILTFLMYFCSFPRYFTVENGFLQYKRNITFPDNGNDTDIHFSFVIKRGGKPKESAEITFCVQDIYSIEISQTPSEKAFNIGRVTFQGHMYILPDKYEDKVINRKAHTFYGVRNPDELYADLCKFFPDGVVKNNTSWR